MIQFKKAYLQDTERNESMTFFTQKAMEVANKELGKKQLAGISQYTVNKLNWGEAVTIKTLSKICNALRSRIEDICEV